MPLLSNAGIDLSRTPYEEPYHLCLRITASNGRVRGELAYYCNADHLRELGTQLRSYTGDSGREIIYELGSENPTDRFAFFVSLRVKAIDSLGHCCVIVRLNNNEPPPNREITEFSIAAEVADVNRLGDLLIEFGQLRHRRLVWRVTSGELLEDGGQAA